MAGSPAKGFMLLFLQKKNWDPIEHKGEKTDISGIPGGSWVATVQNQMREFYLNSLRFTSLCRVLRKSIININSFKGRSKDIRVKWYLRIRIILFRV